MSWECPRTGWTCIPCGSYVTDLIEAGYDPAFVQTLARLVEEHGAQELSYSTVRDYVRVRRAQIDVEAGRANLRRLGTRQRLPPPPRPSRRCGPWNGSPGEEPGRPRASSTGKTLFLEALGQQAVEGGIRVAWFRL
jgi:hypothetical protein